MWNKYKIALLFFAIAAVKANAQDTTAILKEFNKVMSFSVQPYVYYTAVTKMEASPVLQQEDTLSTKGEFYKNENNLYYSSRQEELFIEDSLFIQINHNRKSIWISKVDVDTKDKMNLLPMDNKAMQELFKKKYTISKTTIDNKSTRLNFEAKQYYDSVSVVIVNIGLQYSAKKLLPELLQLNVNIKQLISDEQVQELQAQGTAIMQAIQSTDGNNYFTRTQQVTVKFESVDNSKEKALQMPSWKEKLNYNIVSNDFSGKGIYGEYEITKTF